MKVLITLDWNTRAVNGVVVSVMNLYEELKKRGHEVKIITISEERASKKDGDIYFLKSYGAGKLYPNARVSLKLKREWLFEILSWKPDIIHTQTEFSSFMVARKISKMLGIPIVHTYHTIYEDYTHYFSPVKVVGKEMTRQFTNFIIKKTNGVIVPTDKTKLLLIRYGVRRNLFVIATGIDLTKFKTTFEAEAKKELYKKHGINEKDLLLIFVGRLSKEKNVEEVIDYVKKTESVNGKAVKLIIVGGGPYKEDLQEYVEKVGAVDKVIFTDMVAPDEVPNYFKLGNIFVSGSTSETQGLTYVESAAAGLPAVCRKDMSIDGVVVNGKTGYQYTDYNSFYNGISEISKDEDTYNKFVENAKNMAEEYSSATFAKKAEDVYKEVIQNVYV